jgi:hypothetical protein
MLAWLEIALEDGRTIPEPRPLEDYSGRFVVRVPKSLHRDLTDAANAEGVSLNAYINTELARSVGHPTASKSMPVEDNPHWPGLRRAVPLGHAEESR